MTGNKQLYYNGDIYTVDPRLPSAEAVAVTDGKIIAVGSLPGCRAASGNDCEEIDLKGSALLPGFIDTHMHPVLLVYYGMNVNLQGTRSMEELKDRLAAAAARTKAGNWLVGLNFDEESMDHPRMPDRHILDAAGADIPIMIIRHDGHTVAANTAAIKAANVSADTADPPSGIIEREPGGHPSGVFREAAAPLILNAMPLPDMESLTEGVKSTFLRLASQGITSIGAILQTGEDGPAGTQGSLDIPALELFLDHIPVNLYCLLIASDIGKVKAALSSPLNGERGRRHIGGLKIIGDGTFGSCTAYMSQPFTDQPDKSGFLNYERDEIYRRMEAAHKEGMQVEIHAIGDAAARVFTDLFRKLLSEHPRRDHRHRLQHASLLDSMLIRDIADLGLVVSTQPQFIHSEKHWLHKRLGDRVARVYPFRSLIDGGVRVAGASDAPIESTDVLHSIQVCVTREGFETRECITAAEAVRMFTLDAAYAQFEDDVKGSISPGKRADLVVLSRNPVSVSPQDISGIKIERTIIGGKIVYN